MYSTELDRLDVAVRSVWHDAKKGGRLLHEAGISPTLVAQVQALDRRKPTTERQVFAVLRACPELLPAAALMLHHYYQACAESRTEFYRLLSLLGGTDE